MAVTPVSPESQGHYNLIPRWSIFTKFLKCPKTSLVGIVAGITTQMTIFFLQLFIRWRKKGTALLLSLCLPI